MLYQKGDLVHIPSNATLYYETCEKQYISKKVTDLPMMAVYLESLNYHYSLVATIRGNRQVVKTSSLSFIKEAPNVSRNGQNIFQ